MIYEFWIVVLFFFGISLLDFIYKLPLKMLSLKRTQYSTLSRLLTDNDLERNLNFIFVAFFY